MCKWALALSDDVIIILKRIKERDLGKKKTAKSKVPYDTNSCIHTCFSMYKLFLTFKSKHAHTVVGTI